MSDDAADFHRLLSGLSAHSKEADLLLLQLDEPAGERVRLCAIPHTFDETVVRLLDDTLTEQTAREFLETLDHLPAIVQLPGCRALHDVVRSQLFSDWLTPERLESFRVHSSKLADFYHSRLVGPALPTESLSRSYQFHAIGADPATGFAEFQKEYNASRRQSRISDCAALVRLAREYEAILTPAQLAWLSYYDAEILDGTQGPAASIRAFEPILEGDLPNGLRVRALLSVASALRRLGRFREARARCVEAEKSATGFEVTDLPRHAIQHEFGMTAFEEGRFHEAKARLETALQIAREKDGPKQVAEVLNSLGVIFLKAAPGEAARRFQECLALLDPATESAWIARVLNNLALAFANDREWHKSEEHYQRSLALKRNSSDRRGEANTLLNMARVFRAQGKLTEARKVLLESSELFRSVHDLASAAKAHRELARMLRSMGEKAEAAREAQEAVAAFGSSGDTREQHATTREFASLGREGRGFWVISTVLLVVLVMIVALTYLLAVS